MNTKQTENATGPQAAAWKQMTAEERLALLNKLHFDEHPLTKRLPMLDIAAQNDYGKLPGIAKAYIVLAFRDGRFSFEGYIANAEEVRSQLSEVCG